MKTLQEKKIKKLEEIIKDAFYQTGYSNGKLKFELAALDKEIEQSDEGIWEAANHIDSHLFESFWDAYVAGAKWYRDHASQHKGKKK